MKTVHVAVGVIVDSQDRVCIAKRLQGTHLAGLWEFPGGKVEAGESVFDALKRELQEELAITISASTPLIKVDFTYPEKTVLLDVHSVRAFEGEALGSEGQEVRWVSRGDLSNYTFPEANAPILRAVLGSGSES